MNDNGRDARDNMSIKEQARKWLARLEHDKSPETRVEFEAWLAASEEHRREFAWIEKVYANSEILTKSEKFGRNREARDRSARPRSWLMIGTAAAAAAAVLLIAFGAGSASLPGSSMSAQAAVPLVTQRGEIRSFRLADGSTATLDTDSKVEVSITEQERYLRLSHGRARFEVAPDPRPFRVQAGAGEVTARRGVFDVAYDDATKITVRLISGDADIGPASQQSRDAVQPLRQDAVTGYGSADYGSTEVRPEAADMLRQDWPNGWVNYRSIRLDQLIAQANRYADKPIILDDPATAALQVTGLFKISETDKFVKRIAELKSLRVSRRNDGIHLRQQ